jgi:acetoin utilization protein AcuB
MIVEELMTPDPITVEEDSSIRDAIRTLHDLDVRHLPVVRHGNLVGMLSDRDVRQVHFDPVQHEWDAQNEVLGRPVSTLMHGDLVVVYGESDVQDAIDLMVEQKIGALPVVDPSTGRLVGILSYIDILAAARGHFD